MGLILAGVLFNITLFAQRDYSTGIGLRGSPFYGFTVKQFVTNQTAFEFIISSKWDGLMIDGLYEFHHNTFNTSNFNLFYGAGGHAGWWSPDVVEHPWFEPDEHISFGVNAIGGIEYAFDEIPFSVSVDWKPLLVIVEDPGFYFDNLGFSIRYNIK